MLQLFYINGDFILYLFILMGTHCTKNSFAYKIISLFALEHKHYFKELRSPLNFAQQGTETP